MQQKNGYPPSPNSVFIQQAIKDARHKWRNWRAAFEHNGPASENPILMNKALFGSFCAEFRVGRTIRKGRHDALRCWLRGSSKFNDAIRDDSGKLLAALEEKELRHRFGTL